MWPFEHIHLVDCTINLHGNDKIRIAYGLLNKAKINKRREGGGRGSGGRNKNKQLTSSQMLGEWVNFIQGRRITWHPFKKRVPRYKSSKNNVYPYLEGAVDQRFVQIYHHALSLTILIVRHRQKILC